MPETQTADPVSAFQSLPPERQKSLLGKMSAEDKGKLNAAIQAKLKTPNTKKPPADDAVDDVPKEAPKEHYWDRYNKRLKGVADAFHQDSVDAQDKAFGVKSDGKSLLSKVGNELKSLAADFGEMVVNVDAAGNNPKDAGILAVGMVDPAVPALYYGSKAALDLPEKTKNVYQDVRKDGGYQAPTPEHLQDFLMTLSQLFSSAGGATTDSPTMRKLGRAGKVVKDTVKASGGGLKSIAQTSLGIGESVARKTGEEALESHAKEVTKVSESNTAKEAKFKEKVADTAKTQEKINKHVEKVNQQKAQEHAEAAAEVEAVNQAQAEGVGRRAELATKIRNDAAQHGEHLKALEKDVREQGKAKYKVVEDAVGNDSVSVSKLANLARTAEKDILKGSQENIKQFREFIKKDTGDGVYVSGMTVHPGDPLYEALVEQGAIEPGPGVKFADLQGYYSEIGNKMFGEGIGDVYRALRYVRDGIGEEMKAMADTHNVGPQLADAQHFWSEYRQAFHNLRSVATNKGSQLARAFRAADPENVYLPFTKIGGDRALADLERYGPELAARMRQTLAERKEMNDLPKKIAPKPLPAAPVPKEAKVLEPPKPPVLEQPPARPTIDEIAKKLKETRKEKIASKADQIGTLNKFDVSGLGYDIYRVARGEMPIAWAFLVAHYELGKVLRNPKAMEWLSDPTPKDMEILNNIYKDNPTGKSEAQTAITEHLKNEAKAGKRVPLKSFVPFLTPRQFHEVVNAYASMGAQSKDGAKKQDTKTGDTKTDDDIDQL